MSAKDGSETATRRAGRAHTSISGLGNAITGKSKRANKSKLGDETGPCPCIGISHFLAQPADTRRGRGPPLSSATAQGQSQSCSSAAENATAHVVGWQGPAMEVWRRTSEAARRVGAGRAEGVCCAPKLLFSPPSPQQGSGGGGYASIASCHDGPGGSFMGVSV